MVEIIHSGGLSRDQSRRRDGYDMDRVNTDSALERRERGPKENQEMMKVDSLDTWKRAKKKKRRGEVRNGLAGGTRTWRGTEIIEWFRVHFFGSAR